MNKLEDYRDILAGMPAWSGEVAKGFEVDFLGQLVDARFSREMFGWDPAGFGGAVMEGRRPTIGDGGNAEDWFEAVNWVCAAREARDRFVMITLGANYGAQAIGSYRAIQALNPMPCKLVAVEPVPENLAWVAQHFRNNGLDPEAHWLVPHVISDTNEPVLFPIGAPGSGAQNCISTNEPAARLRYVKQLSQSGQSDTALHNLLVNNTTGIMKDLIPGTSFVGEIKLVSAVTLHDLLGPFDFVDYLESDIQESEIRVFPPFIDLLKRKVRRIHIGTHGKTVHRSLHELFETAGWEIVFSYEPEATHSASIGSFDTNDGILTVRNPSF